MIFFQDLGSPNFSGSVDGRAPRDREEMQVSRAMASFFFLFFKLYFNQTVSIQVYFNLRLLIWKYI